MDHTQDAPEENPRAQTVFTIVGAADGVVIKADKTAEEKDAD